MTPVRFDAGIELRDCPNCTAPAGSPCRTRGGRTAAKYLTARFTLVSALQDDLHVPPLNRGPGWVWDERPAVVPAARAEVGAPRAVAP